MEPFLFLLAPLAFIVFVAAYAFISVCYGERKHWEKTGKWKANSPNDEKRWEE